MPIHRKRGNKLNVCWRLCTNFLFQSYGEFRLTSKLESCSVRVWSVPLSGPTRFAQMLSNTSAVSLIMYHSHQLSLVAPYYVYRGEGSAPWCPLFINYNNITQTTCKSCLAWRSLRACRHLGINNTSLLLSMSFCNSASFQHVLATY